MPIQCVGRTTGQIADELKEPIFRVKYAIRTRGIEPCMTVGNYNLYDADAIDVIREAIRSIRRARSASWRVGALAMA